MKQDKTFGSNVAKVRQEAGLTQPELAALLKTTREVVSYVETDWSPNPTLRTILLFANALSVPPGCLLEGVTLPKARVSVKKKPKRRIK